MALFSNTTLDSLDDLLVQQIRDLYDAEHRLTKALPDFADAATSPELKQAFSRHLTETEKHVQRLDEVFTLLGRKPEGSACQAMKGLVKEGEQMIHADGDADVKDAALIAAAQRVEHYEIAGYGTARTFAEHLGHLDAARILQATLDEEGEANKTLTRIAETSVNWNAAAHPALEPRVL